MKRAKRIMIAASIVAALVAIPIETANGYWPGAPYSMGPWRSAYIYDPAYRWGTPAMRDYIRDLYQRGPGYAAWRQQRRLGYWW